MFLKTAPCENLVCHISSVDKTVTCSEITLKKLLNVVLHNLSHSFHILPCSRQSESYLPCSAPMLPVQKLELPEGYRISSETLEMELCCCSLGLVMKPFLERGKACSLGNCAFLSVSVAFSFPPSLMHRKKSILQYDSCTYAHDTGFTK